MRHCQHTLSGICPRCSYSPKGGLGIGPKVRITRPRSAQHRDRQVFLMRLPSVMGHGTTVSQIVAVANHPQDIARHESLYHATDNDLTCLINAGFRVRSASRRLYVVAQ